MIYSYVRVSTEKQDFGRQEQAIVEYCEENSVVVDMQFSDKITGKTFDRPEYTKMKEEAKAGDTIIIKEIDRLGRDWDGIKHEWQYFCDNNINVVIIDMPVFAKTTIAEDGTVDLNLKLVQNIMFEMLCYLAQKEREKISQRTKEALAAKKKAGFKIGRQANIENEKKIIELYKKGIIKSQIANRVGVSRDTVYRILKKHELM